jgi:hypothetical protein
LIFRAAAANNAEDFALSYLQINIPQRLHAVGVGFTYLAQLNMRCGVGFLRHDGGSVNEIKRQPAGCR